VNTAELLAEAEHILDIIRETRKQAEPRMNVLDLAGVSHLELKNSDILAFLLDSRALHKCPQFGELFLELIKGILPNYIQGSLIRYVRREQPTNTGRYIDLFLETDKGEPIIIENKVGAEDSPDQLKDYIAWAETSFGVLPVALYLTPSGEHPSESSLPKAQQDALGRAGRFLCLSYEDDIVTWLEHLLQETTDPGQELLRSALIQYKDAVLGFCGLRKEVTMERAHIVDELIKRYGLSDASRMTVADLLETAHGFASAVDYITVLQFLIELRMALIQTGHERVVFTLGQQRYEVEAVWVAACKDHPTDLGVEIVREGIGQPQYGIGIEFSEATRGTSLYFGIMAHNCGVASAPAPMKLPYDSLREIGKVFETPFNWWWQYASPNSWFNEALFRYGNNMHWQDSYGSLAQHVAKNWVGPLIKTLGTGS